MLDGVLLLAVVAVLVVAVHFLDGTTNAAPPPAATLLPDDILPTPTTWVDEAEARRRIETMWREAERLRREVDHIAVEFTIERHWIEFPQITMVMPKHPDPRPFWQQLTKHHAEATGRFYLAAPKYAVIVDPAEDISPGDAKRLTERRATYDGRLEAWLDRYFERVGRRGKEPIDRGRGVVIEDSRSTLRDGWTPHTRLGETPFGPIYRGLDEVAHTLTHSEYEKIELAKVGDSSIDGFPCWHFQFTDDGMAHTYDYWVDAAHGYVIRRFEAWPVLGPVVQPVPDRIVRVPQMVDLHGCWLPGKAVYEDLMPVKRVASRDGPDAAAWLLDHGLARAKGDHLEIVSQQRVYSYTYLSLGQEIPPELFRIDFPAGTDLLIKLDCRPKWDGVIGHGMDDLPPRIRDGLW